MNIIPELLTPETKQAISWGKSHPKEMSLNKCPFEVTDYDNFQLWHLAKEAERLSRLNPAQQLEKFEAKESIKKKMNTH